MSVTIEIHNEDVIADRMQPRSLRGPLIRFFDRAGNEVLNHAKTDAAVDTGLLRASLAQGGSGNLWDMDSAAIPEWLRVGSRVSYAPFVEHGGGDLSDDPGATSGWTFPSPADLDGWARRHGLNAWAVAKAIRRRGGVMPQPFLRPGLQTAEPKITGQHLATLGKEIAQELRG